MEWFEHEVDVVRSNTILCDDSLEQESTGYLGVFTIAENWNRRWVIVKITYIPDSMLSSPWTYVCQFCEVVYGKYAGPWEMVTDTELFAYKNGKQ